MSDVRFLVLATGSKGNCAWVSTPHSNLLIDCGIGIRALDAILRRHGSSMQEIDAVLITHAHSDHTQGLGTLLKYVPARVYAHQRAAAGLTIQLRRAMARHDKRASYRDFELSTFDMSNGFYHRDVDVLPVAVSHDCDPTVMYKLHTGGRWLGVLTDLGTTTAELTGMFGDCDALLLEANHCPQLLAEGPYPPMLKRRIRGSLGHLSNSQAVEFATGLGRMPRHLLLGHMSDTNNTPQSASDAFTRVETGRFPHTVIPQQTCGPLLEL
jgi:phosphoribosyl 1,2-cyclic phosphodiesterase